MNRSVLVGLGLIGLLLTSCQESASITESIAGNTTTTSGGYKVDLEIMAKGGGPAYANAHVYDASGKFVDGSSIMVDSIALAHASGDYYFANLNVWWPEGSRHTYTIKTPDGKTATGTVSSPSGPLIGAGYLPGKPTIAKSYKVSPPPGGWPKGSCVTASITKPGPAYYGITRMPTGDSAITISGSYLDSAVSVSFYAAFQTRDSLSGYAAGSFVRVIGTSTSW